MLLQTVDQSWYLPDLGHDALVRLQVRRLRTSFLILLAILDQNLVYPTWDQSGRKLTLKDKSIWEIYV